MRKKEDGVDNKNGEADTAGDESAELLTGEENGEESEEEHKDPDEELDDGEEYRN